VTTHRFLSLATLMAFLLTASPVGAATVPSNLVYEGRILDSSRNPVTSAVVLRFSLWKSEDWTSGDASGGAVNTSASNYGGWYEVQTVTPNSSGILSAQLGSNTALPTLDFSQHKYLQVEVKSVGQPDTSFVLLDPTGDSGSDSIDRRFIGSVAYAKNAESVGNRTVGTASGNILILGPNGRINAAQMGSGTTAQNFTINVSNAAEDTTLTFGNALAPETLKFSHAADRFEFSDDVLIRGNLTMTGSLTASGSIATEGGVTINKDNAATNAVLTFGNSLGQQTLQYSATNQRFEFSTDVRIGGNLTVTGTVNGLNLSTLNVTPLQVTAGSSLTIAVASGSYRLGSAMTNYAGITNVSVTASATNYVFFGSGGLTVRTTSFPADESFIPLALVTTSSNAVTGVTDRRVLQTDTREHDVTETITPEFDKATYQGDATDNVGMLSLTQDNSSKRNYYLWMSEETTLQDYDIFVRFLLPRDFVRWKTDTTTPLQVEYRSTSANSTENKLDISIYDTNGSPVTLSGPTTNLASIAWAQTPIEFLGNPTWTPGGEFLIKLHVSAKSSNQMHLGSLKLHYTALMGQ
jgi:hypothetical protein